MTDTNAVADQVTNQGNKVLRWGLKAFKWGGLTTTAFTAAALTISTAGLAAPASAAALSTVGGSVASGITAASTYAAGTSIAGSAAMTNAALSSTAGFGWATYAQIPLEGFIELTGMATDGISWLSETLSNTATPSP